MTEIQQNRYDRLVRRVNNIVAPGSMVGDALSELFPMIDVENMPAELLALMPTTLGWCSSLLSASALNRNHHQLFNPEDSSVLIAVTSIDFESPGAQFFRFSNFLGEQATLAGNERRRDTRAGTLASIVAQNRTGQSTTSGGLDYRIRAEAGIGNKLADQNAIAVIFPGTGLTVSTEVVNTASVVSFMWRERVFEPAEVLS